MDMVIWLKPLVLKIYSPTCTHYSIPQLIASVMLHFSGSIFPAYPSLQMSNSFEHYAYRVMSWSGCISWRSIYELLLLIQFQGRMLLLMFPTRRQGRYGSTLRNTLMGCHGKPGTFLSVV